MPRNSIKDKSNQKSFLGKANPLGKRRVLTAEYKLSMLKKIDSLKGYGDIGELLHREGLYYSTISNWRRLWKMNRLGTTPRGRKKKSRDVLARENIILKRQVQNLERQVTEIEALMELQQKFFKSSSGGIKISLTATRIALIEKAGVVCGLGKVCDALGISRATFYRYRK